MIPVNIKMFDIEADSSEAVERIKLEREIDRFNDYNFVKDTYVLNNDKILNVNISISRKKLDIYLEQLKSLATNFIDSTEIVSHEELFGFDFPIYFDYVGHYRLKGKLKKTLNYTIPNRSNDYNSLFYKLCEIYNKEGKNILISKFDLNLINNFKIAEEVDTDRFLSEDRINIINSIIDDLNVEILSVHNYSGFCKTLDKVSKLKTNSSFINDYIKLNRINLDAQHNQTLFDELGIKIEKEKQKVKQK